MNRALLRLVALAAACGAMLMPAAAEAARTRQACVGNIVKDGTIACHNSPLGTCPNCRWVCDDGTWYEGSNWCDVE